MAERNEDVLKMIAQLQARLVDLEADVRAFEGDLPDMAKRLDHVDDRIYLLEVEIESRAAQAAAGPGQPAPAPNAAAGSPAASAGGEGNEDAAAPEGSDGSDDGRINILTPEAKEKLGETVGDLREIGRTGAETLSELNEAFSDITAPFKSFMKPRRRF